MGKAPERLGRYRLLHRIGGGGMGEVHRARAYGAEGVVKELCIKRIRLERLTTPGARDAFIREARLSARLAHPNIVPVFDFGRCEEQYYLAMEWIDGADLSNLLVDRTLDDHVVAHVAAEVARALSYAHEAAPDAPIVHRDVKPANVLISRMGDVRLGDFGVASGAGDEGVAGTPAYMAPEASRGAVTVASDVYSLGRLIERARGEVPTPEDEVLGALAGELLDPDPARRPSAAAVATRLEAFVARRVAEGGEPPRALLAARVAEVVGERDRLPSAERPLAEAESFLHGPEPTASTVAKPPAGRRPRGAGAMLGASVALAILAVGLWQADPSADATAPQARADARDERGAAPAEPPSAAPSRVERERAQPLDEPPAEARVDAPVPPPAPRRASRRIRPPSAEAPPPPAPATLSVNAIPWARVLIDGEPRGTTPILRLSLAPGVDHTVVLENEVLGARAERTVRLEPGRHEPLIVDLRAP